MSSGSSCDHIIHLTIYFSGRSCGCSRSATPTSSMRTVLGGTALAKRKTNCSCPTPPTRSSLRPNRTFERGIRRHGHYHCERLVQVLHWCSPGPGNRCEDEEC